MSLILRLAVIFSAAFFKKPIGFLEESVLHLRVLPNDLDVYGHVNNGRYLTMMDLGRVDMMIRTGLWKLSRKHGWNPLVSRVSIDYKKPLGLMEKFHMRTRIVGWDEKRFFIEQIFENDGTVYARAVVKGLFRGREGSISSEIVLSALGYAGTRSPALPGGALS